MKWLSVWLIVVLSGCSVPAIGGLVDQRSIVQQVQEEIRRPGATILAGPDVKLMEQTPAGLAVVYTYQAEEDGQKRRHSSITFFEQGPSGWSPRSGSSSGSPLDLAPQPVEYSWGASRGDRQYAYVSGLVADPAVSTIVVVFDDRVEQRVAVKNGAYVLARLGNAQIVNAKALDTRGTVIHQQKGR